MFLFTACSKVQNRQTPFANGDTDAADTPLVQPCWKYIELNYCTALGISCPTAVIPFV